MLKLYAHLNVRIFAVADTCASPVMDDEYADHLLTEPEELYGAAAIAFDLFGFADMEAQVEHLAETGVLPHYRRGGVLCMTVSAMRRFTSRYLGAQQEGEIADV